MCVIAERHYGAAIFYQHFVRRAAHATLAAQGHSDSNDPVGIASAVVRGTRTTRAAAAAYALRENAHGLMAPRNDVPVIVHGHHAAISRAAAGATGANGHIEVPTVGPAG